MKRNARTAIALVLTFSAGYAVNALRTARAAGIPATQPLSYAGVLEDASGPLSGLHNLTIQVWSGETAGSKLCESVATSYALKPGGRFTVPLVDECTTVFAAQTDAWLDVLVDDAPVGSRTKVGAVPYAVEARHAATASGADKATIATTAAHATTADGATQVSVAANIPLIGSLPTNGSFALQAGTDAFFFDANGHYVINLPHAFPNGLVTVLVTNSFAQGAVVAGVLDNEALGSFTVSGGANQNARINWLAIGW